MALNTETLIPFFPSLTISSVVNNSATVTTITFSNGRTVVLLVSGDIVISGVWS